MYININRDFLKIQRLTDTICWAMQMCCTPEISAHLWYYKQYLTSSFRSRCWRPIAANGPLRTTQRIPGDYKNTQNNKTNHPISSNSHPSVSANEAIYCIKRGGLQNQRKHNIILKKYEAVQPTTFSENNSSSGMQNFFRSTNSIYLKANNLPISVSKTNTRNFCIDTSCKVMTMYEITISKSFAN